MYQTWENSIQGIRNINDVDLFQTDLDQTVRFFVTEFKKKEQCLKAYKAQNDEKLEKNTKHLEDLQNQCFESSTTKQLAIVQQTHLINYTGKITIKIKQAILKESSTYDKFRQKASETIHRLTDIFTNLQQQHNENQQQGLTQERIRRFQLFMADESNVGDQCSICMEEIDVGRRMRRLDCDGQHAFCQVCIEGWFAGHNSCPLCRHKFD